MADQMRSLCVVVDQWDAYALDEHPLQPLAVVSSNMVLAVNRAAARDGVRPRMKRRDAQATCPSVLIKEHDPSLSALRFEAVLEVIGSFVPRIEVIEPGRCVFPTLGPARYHGGEDALAQQLLARLSSLFGGEDPPMVGLAIAGGPRTALIAASAAVQGRLKGVVRNAGQPNTTLLNVPSGEDAKFLAPLTIRYLEPILGEETVDLFRRLGLRSIGSFAALERADVIGRFGSEALEAHHLANGEEREPPHLDVPDLAVRATRAFEPPLAQVDQVAFVAKAMADDLLETLSGRGLTAGKVLVAAEVETGERMERIWQTERTFSVTTITQRVRWQLEGWMGTSGSASRDQGAVTFLEIEPQALRPDKGEQTGFWGETHLKDQLVMNGIARIQALFGADSVRVPRLRGGRSPRDAYQLLEVGSDEARAGSVRAGPERAGSERAAPERPWPGALPPPSPTRVWKDPIPAQVVDSDGDQIQVSGRGLISAAPSWVSTDGASWMRVQSWSGPWCVDERWWDPTLHRRKARVQVLLSRPTEGSDQGRNHPSRLSAHLLTLEGGNWWVEATYD